MSDTAPISNALMEKWHADKLDPSSLEAQLRASGLDEASVAIHLQAYQKLKQSKKQFNGFIVTGLGAFLGFVSCVLTLTNPVPEIYYLILYGLTSIAILTICAGLYLIFE
jgi:hypothetical protein